MSKVIEQPPVPPAPEPAQDPGWILDEAGNRQRSWILDGPEESPEVVPPAAAPPPVAAPPPGAPGSLPGQGYQYTTDTGYVFRGSTPEDVLKQMEAAVMRSAQMATDAQRQLSAQTDYERGGTRREPEADKPPFDAQNYYKLLADVKPLEAMEYALQHYLGMENPKEAISSSYSTAQQVSDRFAVADFMTNNPDFPASPQAAEALLLRIDREGVPVNRWNLEVAKQQLYSEGILRSVTESPAPASTVAVPSPPAPSRGAGAPPAPRSSSAPMEDRELTEEELWNLPIDKHRAYLQKRGRL